MAGWTWIEGFGMAEDGRGAFLAWTDYYNGQGELSKHTASAKAKIANLFYRNEGSLSFERVLEILTRHFQFWRRIQMKCFQIVRKSKSC
jgi:hypothetical protein